MNPILKDLILSPHHTAMAVNDFEAAKDFFIDVIGMTLEGEIDHRNEPNLSKVVRLERAEIRWAMLVMGHYRIELFKYYSHQRAARETEQCDIGLTHIAFHVTDADLAYQRLMALGYEAYSEPLDLRGGASRPFYVKGPEGIAIEFIQLKS